MTKLLKVGAMGVILAVASLGLSACSVTMKSDIDWTGRTGEDDAEIQPSEDSESSPLEGPDQATARTSC
ncbi:hypothetical protein [Woodsholea maritima]|uniref:hypothetical protein n=1 Tax=Woodsholea maritima TaxID=240237 RepID=UPI00037CCA5D|nr:hypothetical protein [Woodsholea maritima]